MSAKSTTKTTVATLHMEMISTTRIVRRIVEVSTATALPTVAKVIRGTRGLVRRRSRLAFVIGETTDTSTKGRAAKNKAAAKSRRLHDILKADTRAFDFVHNVTDGCRSASR